MNTYLLQLVGKWLSLLLVFVTSTINSNIFNEEKSVISNNNIKKGITPIVEIVKHDTIYKNNKSLPVNVKKIVTNGVDGILSQNKDGDFKVVRASTTQIIEVGTGAKGDFIGRLTGYGPDCKGCTGSGVVSCRTPDRKRYSLVQQGVIYKDEYYGELRILAATHDVFPCGTIVKVSKPNGETFMGIVMDTGYAMRKAWKEEQKILFDLAFETQDRQKNPDIYKVTSNNVNYNVQRWGW